MAKNDWKKRSGVVFSTNPDFNFHTAENKSTAARPSREQRLYVRMDRKGRAGKQVTVIEGFEGSEEDLKELGRLVKTKCGTGGTAKDGIIIIQGDLRSKITEMLKGMGYDTTRGN
ncbi:MAG: translation initiation factor [Bacteroidales bacterium]|jgi:translation initiation factor 1|nr:translation initiation factor [Bacteroidales bacterium]